MRIQGFVCLSVVAGLAACGGGSGGSTTIATTTGLPGAATAAATLRTTNNTVSELEGIGVVIANNPGANSVSDVVTATTPIGSFDHNTGIARINDGNIVLTIDANLNAATALDDLSLATAINRAVISTPANLDFVGGYAATYQLNGTAHLSLGVGGIPSAIAAIPSSGSATFNGESGVLTADVNNADSVIAMSGTSQVNVDFSRNSVSATLGNFSAVQVTSNQAIGAPIDRMAIEDMTIIGTRFSGGTVSTTLNGQNVNIAGASPSITTQGQFFGQDAVGNPDEVGGAVLLDGGDQIAVGLFVAD